MVHQVKRKEESKQENKNEEKLRDKRRGNISTTLASSLLPFCCPLESFPRYSGNTHSRLHCFACFLPLFSELPLSLPPLSLSAQLPQTKTHSHAHATAANRRTKKKGKRRLKAEHYESKGSKPKRARPQSAPRKPTSSLCTFLRSFLSTSHSLLPNTNVTTGGI